MVNLDIGSLGAAYYTGNFHKWCCAPRGSAGLWVREEHRETVAPLVTSWFVGDGYPASFRWLGTDDYTPYLAVPAALEFMRGLGWNRVRAHNRALARYGRDTVGEALGVDPAVDPALDDLFEAMTIIPLPEGIAATAEDVGPFYARVADELGVEVIGSALDGRGYLRLSAQAYNAPADYERLAEGLPRLLGD